MPRAACLAISLLPLALLAACAGSSTDGGSVATSPATVIPITGPGSSSASVILPGVIVGPPRNPRTEASRDANIVRTEMMQLKADLAAGRKQRNNLDTYDRELLQMMELYSRTAKKKGKKDPFGT